MKILSSSSLKWIALISMLIDHIGAVFFPTQYMYRIIGRLAYPIFAFLVSEAMVHTKDQYKYLKRLLVFGLISEIPFDLAFSKSISDLSTWNIMFTLFLGALCIQTIQIKGYSAQTAIITALIMSLAQLINVDGGAYGVMTIVVFYSFRNQNSKILAMLIFIYAIAIGWIYRYAILAMVPISCYNGKKGWNMKWFMYGFYPLHLLILAGIYYGTN